MVALQRFIVKVFEIGLYAHEIFHNKMKKWAKVKMGLDQAHRDALKSMAPIL